MFSLSYINLVYCISQWTITMERDMKNKCGFDKINPLLSISPPPKKKNSKFPRQYYDVAAFSSELFIKISTHKRN